MLVIKVTIVILAFVFSTLVFGKFSYMKNETPNTIEHRVDFKWLPALVGWVLLVVFCFTVLIR